MELFSWERGRRKMPKGSPLMINASSDPSSVTAPGTNVFALDHCSYALILAMRCNEGLMNVTSLLVSPLVEYTFRFMPCFRPPNAENEYSF